MRYIVIDRSIKTEQRFIVKDTKTNKIVHDGKQFIFHNEDAADEFANELNELLLPPHYRHPSLRFS